MADIIQYRMERMVDELEDLEKRGLFTRREIAEIVKKRRDFEYKIKRPRPLKRDYLSYIDYEIQFDALRTLRKRAIIGKLKKERREHAEEEDEEEVKVEGDEGNKRKRKFKGGKLWKRSISDIAGVRRILDIYKLATVKYRGDLDLWFKYLEFCRERRHGAMKQALIQAIRYHPNIPGLWMYAAAWEFDQNLNVAAARALMHNGLRVCRGSEDMWIEYLRMELTYLNKLKARKVALGEDVRTLVRTVDSNIEQSDKLKQENVDISLEEKDEAKELDPNEISLEKREDFFWEHGTSILRTIFEGATEALPSSMTLRKRFLEILDGVDLAHSDELKVEIMEDLQRNFAKDEEYWDWLARYQLHSTALRNGSSNEEAIYKLSKALKVYEDAIENLPSNGMFSRYARFLLDIIVSRKDIGPIHHNADVESLEFSSHLLKVYERAECSGCLTEDLAKQYISFYLQLGKLEEVRSLAVNFCDGRLSHASDLWCLRISIEMKSISKKSDLWCLRISIEMKSISKKSSSLSNDEFDSILQLLRSAWAKTSLSKAENLWFMALKIFSGRSNHFEKLVDSFIVSMARDGGDSSGCLVMSAILDRVIQRDGIRKAREMYKRFLALPHPRLAFLKHCIELETNLTLVGEKDALVSARKVYEFALSVYGSDRELWKNYYNMEIQVGTSETTSAIYWRARKALGDTAGMSMSSGVE